MRLISQLSYFNQVILGNDINKPHKGLHQKQQKVGEKGHDVFRYNGGKSRMIVYHVMLLATQSHVLMFYITNKWLILLNTLQICISSLQKCLVDGYN